jgi:hypothetical protein
MKENISQIESNNFLTHLFQLVEKKKNESGKKIYYNIGEKDVFLWINGDNGKKETIGYMTKDGIFYKTKCEMMEKNQTLKNKKSKSF